MLGLGNLFLWAIWTCTHPIKMTIVEFRLSFDTKAGNFWPQNLFAIEIGIGRKLILFWFFELYYKQLAKQFKKGQNIGD